MTTTIYAFVYNSCIHESAAETISLHFSEEEAKKAMEEHKEKARKKFDRIYGKNNPYKFKFGEDEYWAVDTVTVLP